MWCDAGRIVDVVAGAAAAAAAHYTAKNQLPVSSASIKYIGTKSYPSKTHSVVLEFEHYKTCPHGAVNKARTSSTTQHPTILIISGHAL
jgi:hypothetical protein